MNWILRQLKQPSTWKGIFILAGIAGYSLDPELQNQIITAVIAILGIIEIVKNENKPASTVNVQLPPIEMVARSLGDAGRSRSVADRDPVVERMQPVSPDYSPKEPQQPVDYPPGWNG